MSIVAFTQGLARELGPQEVTVNVIQHYRYRYEPSQRSVLPTRFDVNSSSNTGRVDDIAHAVTFPGEPPE